MATLGSTAEPGPSAEGYGLNVTNHFAIALTMPAGGPWLITELGAWLAGWNEPCDYKLCLWSSGGSLLRSSAGGTVANAGGISGTASVKAQQAITPYEVAGGTVVHVGFARDNDDNVQFSTRSGTRKQWYNASWPSSFGSWSSVSGAIGAFLIYESANSPPNAPTSLNPNGNEVVHSGTTPTVSGTRSDPDSGDYISEYQIAVYKDDGTTLVYGPVTINPSGSPTTFSKVVTVPAAHAYYKWKARTKDSSGEWGPYSALQRFYTNGIPATPPAPTVELDTLTPQLAGSFSDPGDTMAAIQIEVTLNASPYTSKWASGDIAKSGSAWTHTYAGSALVFGTAYRARYRVKDSHGAYSSWSSWKTFTLIQPVGPDNMTPRTTNPRLNDLTPDLTVGHSAQFRNEEIMVRSVGSDSGGTTLWSKTWEGADYANTNSKVRTYAGTALTWGQRIFWKSRVELTDGTITSWSPYFELRLNADPTSPTGMTPTGGQITTVLPDLHADFADPDLDQGDFADLVEIELADNASGTLRWSQSVVPSTPLAHDVTVSPTGMASQTGVTGANATDIITLANHGFAQGQKVRFSAITGGAGLAINTDYFVRDIVGNTFKLAATLGGAAINFTTDITAGTIVPQELALETTYKWRARFTDDFGRVGAWSSYQIFKASAAPVATGVSPTGGAAVIESTPTLDWTFAGSGGKAQYSYQVRIFDKGPTGANYADEVQVHDSGEVVSTATQYDVPFGVLVNTHDYRWEVTVKDTDQLPFTLA